MAGPVRCNSSMKPVRLKQLSDCPRGVSRGPAQRCTSFVSSHRGLLVELVCNIGEHEGNIVGQGGKRRERSDRGSNPGQPMTCEALSHFELPSRLLEEPSTPTGTCGPLAPAFEHCDAFNGRQVASSVHPLPQDHSLVLAWHFQLHLEQNCISERAAEVRCFPIANPGWVRSKVIQWSMGCVGRER